MLLHAKPAEAEADEEVVAGQAVLRALDEGPGEAAVGGAQDAVAVERVGGVVGVPGAGEDDAGVHADGPDAERRDGAVPALALKTGRVSVSGAKVTARDWAGGVGRLPDCLRR